MKGRVFVFLLAVAVQSAAQTVPVVERYRLRFVVDLAEHALAADADLTVRNSSDRPVNVVPLLLYRLMDVESAAGDQGKPLAVTQKVVKFADEPTWQVNAVQVTLPKSLPSGTATTIHLKYGGPLLGYREVMQYVRDTISEDYSLLRSETMPYPIVATTAAGDRRRAVLKSRFDYEVETIVPAGSVVACSGNDVSEPQSRDGQLAYRCTGAASSQMDVAIAKFRVLANPERTLRVYALPADTEAGTQLMAEMRRALDFYRSQFGEMRGGGGALTLIEIPDGWGSYAVRGHIFQAAAAFKDLTRASELYHEVAHIWNAKASDRVQRARWFDEAFASYFETLAVRQFQGQEAFGSLMDRYRKHFIADAERDPRGRTTPIADYGKYELGGYSYTKGAWSLYVLHQFLGDDAFRRSMTDFLAAYADKPADFDDFRHSVEKSSGRDVGRWFDQWISGTESSSMLIEGKSVEEMAARASTL